MRVTVSIFFLQDLDDGGAYPEIIVPQYPLDMGRPNSKSTSNAVAVQLDAEGRVKYDILARQGHNKDKVSYRNRIFSSSFNAKDNETNFDFI